MESIRWLIVMGLAIAHGVARYVFNLLAIMLIRPNHRVLAHACASCDADTRDWDAVQARAQIEVVSS